MLRLHRLTGLARLVHPFPSTLVAVSVVLMGWVAASGAPNWRHLLVAGTAMLLIQFWIGALNDICDRDVDAPTKPWKPLVSGRVPLPAAVAATVALPMAAGALVIPIGAGPTSLLAAVALAGFTYDVRLKRTRWSWVPYVALFPLIPLYACAAVGQLAPELALLLPFGALLGVGVHLANAVPDLEADIAHRAGGLAERLGRTGSLMTSWGLLGGVQVGALATGLWLGFQPRPLLAGVGASLALLVGAVGLSTSGTKPTTLQTNFVMVALAAMALGLGWLAGAAWR